MAGTADKILENVQLAPLTTLKVGGPARYFIRAESEEEIVDGVEFAADRGLELFVLGGGSNVLIADDGFDGLVLQVAIAGIDWDDRNAGGGTHVVRVQAGEDWDGFVEKCVERDLAGIECLSGIPGFVGGTPVQNVGAYGQEVAETVLSVRCFDRIKKQSCELSNQDCGFTYRTSIFNSTERGRYIVLSVVFELQPNGTPRLVYKDLTELFGERVPTLAEVRDAVLRVRRAKSMVIDLADPNSRSAGSFFKNPIVEKSKFDTLNGVAGGNVPSFDAGPGHVKIPAAWLIENAGFQKGFRSGNAGISSNHALALINRGGATAGEIMDLKSQIQAAVESKFGIRLQPEPVLLGFEE